MCQNRPIENNAETAKRKSRVCPIVEEETEKTGERDKVLETRPSWSKAPS